MAWPGKRDIGKMKIENQIYEEFGSILEKSGDKNRFSKIVVDKKLSLCYKDTAR